MLKALKFKVVVDDGEVELASAPLDYEILSHIGRAMGNWNEGPIYKALHKYLVRYPHPEIWREVATVCIAQDVGEELLKKPDNLTIVNLANNASFMKRVSEDQLLGMVARDASVAIEVARNRGLLSDNISVNIERLNASLEALGNYEVDAELASDDSFNNVVKKMSLHPDPFVMATAKSSLN